MENKSQYFAVCAYLLAIVMANASVAYFGPASLPFNAFLFSPPFSLITGQGAKDMIKTYDHPKNRSNAGEQRKKFRLLIKKESPVGKEDNRNSQFQADRRVFKPKLRIPIVHPLPPTDYHQHGGNNHVNLKINIDLRLSRFTLKK